MTSEVNVQDLRIKEPRKETTLSAKAVEDLRIALQKKFGADFVAGFSDKEINRIGVVILTGLVESLKIEIANPELAAQTV